MADLISLSAIMLMAAVGAAAGAGIVWAAARLRLARQAHELRVRDWSLSNLRTELDDREELLHAFLAHTTDIAIHLDTAGQAGMVSPSCQDILGYPPADMRGHAFFDLFHPDDVTWARDMVVTCAANATAREGEFRLRRRDGQLVTMAMRCRPLPGRLGQLLILSDVSRRHRAEEQLTEARTRLDHLARYDGLTGLPNRQWFLERLQTLANGPFPDNAAPDPGVIAVLLVDLDGFRAINEQHGPLTGDSTLRDAADRLVRDGGESLLTGRIGDDAFAVVVRAPDGDMQIAARAREIIRSLSMVVPGTAEPLSATIGIAVHGRDGQTASMLLHAATIALGQAQLSGHGAYRFHEHRTPRNATASDPEGGQPMPELAA